LPLGDFVSNRKLVLICITVQLLSLGTMALAESYGLFLAASTVLGFFTLTPYLLPAYVSKRVEGAQLGRATATLTTGVVAGVLLSRTGSGVIAEYGGWRAVYGVATGLMALALAILAWRLEGKAALATTAPGAARYGTMMLALGRLALAHPRVLLSGAIQGLSFAIFLLLWLGLGLHLTGPKWNLGTDIVGGLAALTNERDDLVTSIAGPVIDVTGRMTALREDPAIRTRLMTLYTTIMFLLAGLGSALGTSTYAAYGWNGIVLASTGLSLSVVLATHLGYRLQQRGVARP
ncbi:MAG: MFS transporter, partial [Pseudomonadales bacterium]